MRKGEKRKSNNFFASKCERREETISNRLEDNIKMNHKQDVKVKNKDHRRLFMKKVVKFRVPERADIS